MSKGQREALELAEASRDPLDDRGSFASNLFVGRYDFDRIYPYPAQSEEDRATGEEFLQKLESYLREHVDPDEIDRTGEIPPENFEGLGGDRCVRNQSPEEIWRARSVAMQLRTRCRFTWQLGRKRGRPRFGTSIDWCCAAAAAVWDGRAETKISAARRAEEKSRHLH